MAHFAKIVNSIVEQVIVVSNDDIQNKEFPKSESIGQYYIKSIGLDGVWLQTSFNSKFRKHYASIGYSYNSELDAFIRPKPYPSWQLDKNTCDWIPPVPQPKNNPMVIWDENSKTWKPM
jgi:hypothetical protein